MDKVQLKTWACIRKKAKHTACQQIKGLRINRSLFACLMIFARSRPETDLVSVVTDVSRAHFNPDGLLLPCTDKGKFLALLDSTIHETLSARSNDCTNRKRVTIKDSIAIV